MINYRHYLIDGKYSLTPESTLTNNNVMVSFVNNNKAIERSIPFSIYNEEDQRAMEIADFNEDQKELLRVELTEHFPQEINRINKALGLADVVTSANFLFSFAGAL